MIFLVVKGTREEATEAAKLRGLALEYVDRTQDGYTLGNVVDGMLSSVIAWMHEERSIVPGEGYPRGTLLWYKCPEWLDAEEGK